VLCELATGRKKVPRREPWRASITHADYATRTSVMLWVGYESL
jgi:hypothetical protein